MEENDSRKLRIEFHKADALRELRPHLDPGDRKNVVRASSLALKRAAMRYLSRVVYAHLESLLESYPIPSDVDIEAFTDRAIQDAQDHGNSPELTEVAGIGRIYLVDAARATYLGALAVKKTRYTSPSPFGAFDHDHDYEAWCRAACEGFLTKCDAVALALKESPQMRSSRRAVVGTPSANEAQNASSIEELKYERFELLTA